MYRLEKLELNSYGGLVKTDNRNFAVLYLSNASLILFGLSWENQISYSEFIAMIADKLRLELKSA